MKPPAVTLPLPLALAGLWVIHACRISTVDVPAAALSHRSFAALTEPSAVLALPLRWRFWIPEKILATGSATDTIDIDTDGDDHGQWHSTGLHQLSSIHLGMPFILDNSFGPCD